MQHNDTDIQRNVIDELRWDPRAGPAAEIGVAVKAGVATLSGIVDSFARKNAIIRAAERVAGVKAIAEELRVALPTSRRKPDAEVAHAAANALQWDVEVPENRVKVRVDDGWVWLEGEVEWQYQAMAAERAVRYLVGVRGVTNSLRVEGRPLGHEIRMGIVDALKRYGEDAKRISVETRDSTVVLRGTVRSWAEREDAEHAAWSAPGVAEVDDQLVVHA